MNVARDGHVFLSGFMAVGKSTVGPLVAAALDRPFFDLDARVVAAAGRSVPDIFAQGGEPAFRAHERAALDALLAELRGGPAAVIALGGGTVVDPAVRRRLRGEGWLVTLSLDAPTLLARLAADGVRPLARPSSDLRALLAARASAYADADAQVALDGLSPAQAAQAVLACRGRPAGAVSPATAGAEPLEVTPAQVGSEAISTLVVALPATPARSVPVHFGLGLEGRLVDHLATRSGSGRVLLVSDARVAPLHGVRLTARLRQAGLRPHLLVFAGGEASKTLETVGHLAAEAIAAGVDRDTCVVALGGGVVGDVAGLLAALLLRGLDCVQVPTSLLAQVDSSVGGKTAVNHSGGKNLVGVFAQPSAVFIDVAYLDTLPRREWRSGLAEVIKHAALAEPDLLEAAVAVAESGACAGYPALELVRRAVAIKAHIVAADEREAGIRRWLNLGHTVGHAFEAVHVDRLRHGEAVSLGLAVALRLAQDLTRLGAPEAERVREALRRCQLPLDFESWLTPAVVERVALDKKVRGEYVDLVLLEALGRPVIQPVAVEALRARLWALVATPAGAEPLRTFELSTGELS